MQAEARTCVIAGGGPAGMMLGLLLARAGIQVLVLEKHADFLRDFRGDTVHASTVRLLDELGLGDRFRALPQSQLRGFELPGPDGSMTVIADFRTLRPPYNYVAMVPQWDLLSLLADAARCEPQFELQMEREVVDLLTDGGRTVGVRTRSSAGEVAELRCDLVVGCDGRDSVVRRRAGLVPRAYQVPFDTWWFRLPRDSGPAPQEDRLQPRFGRDEILLSIPRPGYFQLAYIAAKNADRRIAEEGIEKFRARIGQLRPDLADRVGGIASLHDLHHLDVKLDRLRTWHRPRHVPRWRGRNQPGDPRRGRGGAPARRADEARAATAPGSRQGSSAPLDADRDHADSAADPSLRGVRADRQRPGD
jgi:2-polyprenyl-6-methoxyphenol hydroxylase-like FAD-dependent oxidoreductase